jgi:hypothetical protein
MFNPYLSKPERSFWSKSVSALTAHEFDPVANSGFKISRSTRISTAGSCFAQHIAREVRERGFNYHITEEPHPVLPKSLYVENSYGAFSARYGNIYTAKQLLQLFKRAYGILNPKLDPWVSKDGRFLDPFRPIIQKNGFCSVLDLEADVAYHLKCVRDLFENTDIFVFTLGLTEGWESIEDQLSFPICPAVYDKNFSFERYKFINYSVTDVTSDLSEFVSLLRGINPNVKIVLTVSPVPLIATYTDEHVAVATTYSKSVLRVAASEIVEKFDGIDYFPSYEIITCNYNRGAYTAAGVDHVMSLFFKHYSDASSYESLNPSFVKSNSHDKFSEVSSKIAKASCDEELLDLE